MAENTKKPWWTPAKRATIECLFFALLVALGLFYYFLTHPDKFEKTWKLYDGTLRGSIFSGFLSVAGFLLALHTFIIVKMREEVYDNTHYIEDIAPEYDKDEEYSRYAPLQNLSGLLFSSILMSILTAASQLSIGLIKIPWTFCFIIMMILTTILLFILSLFHVRGNIVRWMDLLTKNERPKV